MINGHWITILVGVATGLLSLVVALIGLILKQHKDADDEHRVRIDKEVDRLREKMHHYGNLITDLQAQQWLKYHKAEEKQR